MSIKQTFKRLLPISIVIALTLLFSTVAYQTLTKTEEERCWQLLGNSAQSANREVQLTIENNLQLLNLIASTMPNQFDADSYGAITGHISAFQYATNFSRIDVVFPNDTVLMAKGEVHPIQDGFPSFAELSAQGKQISTRTTDPVSGHEVVYFSMPVVKMRSAAVSAILVGVLDCQDLPNLFQSTLYDGQAELCLVDSQDGSFLLDSWHGDTLGNLYTLSDEDAALGDEISQNIQQEKTGIFRYSFSLDNSEDVMLYYMPVGLSGWELLLVVPKDVAFSGLFQLRQTLLAIGAVELLLLTIYLLWNISTLNQLQKSQAETLKQLTVSNTLIECVTELSATQDIDVAINRLLQIICRYFKGDRSYIFSIDYDRQTTSNTYEYVVDGVTREINHLQDVPLEVISMWMNRFRTMGSFYISNTETESSHSDPRTYEMLKEQNIHQLLAVPLLDGNQITGFVGVDNPREHCQDATLLSSIQFFVSNSLATKLQQEELHYLSYNDVLTNLYNRNKYMQVLDFYGKQPLHKVGVAYLDLNGLKAVNDQQGHEAGDTFIRSAAQQIRSVFPRCGYRVGGDEFVVLLPNVEEAVFQDSVQRMRTAMQEHPVSVSIGHLWMEQCDDLDAMLKQVDRLMYEDKSQYYKLHDRRKSSR